MFNNLIYIPNPDSGVEDRDPGGLAVSMLLVLDLGLSSDIVETKVDCKTLFNKYRKSEKGT